MAIAATRKFNRTAGAVPARKSRFAGVKCATPRDPIPQVGGYRFAIRAIEEGFRGGAKTTLEVIATEGISPHEIGAFVFIPECLVTSKGAGIAPGLGRFKSMVMAAMGFETEEEYDAFDPEGANLDAALGEVNAFAKDGQPGVGRYVDCVVTRGNATPDGQDYYRNYEWFVVPEAEQPEDAPPAYV